MLIIGDEPTGNLDSKTGQAVMELLINLNQEGKNEAILSTSTLEHINRWLNANLQVNDVIKTNGVDVTIVGIMAYDPAGVEVSTICC